MPVILEFFPAAMIELNKEIKYHELLMATLTPSMSLEEKLGHTAAYCNVVIDDYFLEEELENLIHILLQILRKKSAIIIN